jgi:hypothetical protein
LSDADRDHEERYQHEDEPTHGANLLRPGP